MTPDQSKVWIDRAFDLHEKLRWWQLACAFLLSTNLISLAALAIVTT